MDLIMIEFRNSDLATDPELQKSRTGSKPNEVENEIFIKKVSHFQEFFKFKIFGMNFQI